MSQPQTKKIEGSATPAIAVALVAIVVWGVTITIFFRILHNEQEDAAYRFGEQKDRVTKTKTACDNNVAKHQALRVWIEQQRLKVNPPADLLVDMPCAAVVEKE